MYDLKLLWNDFVFISTPSSLDGVVRSAIVSELLKMETSLPNHYWQNIPSDFELNNIININKLEGVSTVCNFILFFSIHKN